MQDQLTACVHFSGDSTTTRRLHTASRSRRVSGVEQTAQLLPRGTSTHWRCPSMLVDTPPLHTAIAHSHCTQPLHTACIAMSTVDLVASGSGMMSCGRECQRMDAVSARHRWTAGPPLTTSLPTVDRRWRCCRCSRRSGRTTHSTRCRPPAAGLSLCCCTHSPYFQCCSTRAVERMPAGQHTRRRPSGAYQRVWDCAEPERRLRGEAVAFV